MRLLKYVAHHEGLSQAVDWSLERRHRIVVVSHNVGDRIANSDREFQAFDADDRTIAVVVFRDSIRRILGSPSLRGTAPLGARASQSRTGADPCRMSERSLARIAFTRL